MGIGEWVVWVLGFGGSLGGGVWSGWWWSPVCLGLWVWIWQWCWTLGGGGCCAVGEFFFFFCY